MNLKTVICWLGVMLLVSCSAPVVPSVATPQSSQASASQQPVTSIPTEHRVAIRIINGQAEFYDRQTGQRLILRGPNFHMLARDGENIVDHLFSPSFYDSN